MRHLIVFCLVAAVAFAATQPQSKGGHTKQRKPSLPKKYIVEDGGYVKHRKVRSSGFLPQYEVRERHRTGRQLPGMRNGGGGYLYNRPVYTPSDHLAARPALPLTEVESHPLSNFPAHYSGDLEQEPKEVKKPDKKPEEQPVRPTEVPSEKNVEEKEKVDTPIKTAEAPKIEVAPKEKPEAPLAATKSPVVAAVKTTSKPAAETTTKKKEEQSQVTQQETVSTKPPAASVE